MMGSQRIPLLWLVLVALLLPGVLQAYEVPFDADVGRDDQILLFLDPRDAPQEMLRNVPEVIVLDQENQGDIPDHPCLLPWASSPNEVRRLRLMESAGRITEETLESILTIDSLELVELPLSAIEAEAPALKRFAAALVDAGIELQLRELARTDEGLAKLSDLAPALTVLWLPPRFLWSVFECDNESEKAEIAEVFGQCARLRELLLVYDVVTDERREILDVVGMFPSLTKLALRVGLDTDEASQALQKLNEVVESSDITECIVELNIMKISGSGRRCSEGLLQSITDFAFFFPAPTLEFYHLDSRIAEAASAALKNTDLKALRVIRSKDTRNYRSRHFDFLGGLCAPLESLSLLGGGQSFIPDDELLELLPRLYSLKELHLESMPSSECIQALAELDSLEVLRIEGDTVRTHQSAQEQLAALVRLFKALNPSKLRELELMDVDLPLSAIERVGDFEKLEVLRLEKLFTSSAYDQLEAERRASLYQSLALAIATMSNLHTLALESPGSDELRIIARAQSLREVMIERRNDQAYAEILEAFAEARALETLAVDAPSMTDKLPSSTEPLIAVLEERQAAIALVNEHPDWRPALLLYGESSGSLQYFVDAVNAPPFVGHPWALNATFPSSESGAEE